MSLKNLFTITNLTQVTALALSSVAAWFAIAGLISIFPARATGILVMGGIIEVAKIVAVVWLRKYWVEAGYKFRFLLIPMIIISMMLTSMGTFGFLSAAHSEQSLISGDVSAKIAVYDEKIKTQRENIEMARKALQQLDAQVDARLSRGDSETGAERAVTIRRQQQQERNRLQKEIIEAQTMIAKLNEERAPIAGELRKVEAEVGPIKYIAALVYSDNPDANTLEKAVRWVIIMLVIVFDPFAIALVIAASSSREWDRKIKENSKSEPDPEPLVVETKPVVEGSILEPEKPKVEENLDLNEKFDISKHPYLFKPTKSFGNPKPVVYKPEVEEVKQEEKVIEPVEQEIKVEGVTRQRPYEIGENGYARYDGKQIHLDALKELHPELFITADSEAYLGSKFGTQFPKEANKNDVYVRVDMIPNRVYKFDGYKWVEINKDSEDMNWNDNEYLQYLVSKIDSGEYNIELLSDLEKENIARYLESQK
jgi:hypothetical protein